MKTGVKNQMAMIGKYHGIPVYSYGKDEFRDVKWDSQVIYLIDGKHLVTTKSGSAEIFGQLDSNEVFEFATRVPLYFEKKKKQENKKNVYKEKHNHADCPVAVNVEYQVEEISDTDLTALSKVVDDFLAAAAVSEPYKDILFESPFGV